MFQPNSYIFFHLHIIFSNTIINIYVLLFFSAHTISVSSHPSFPHISFPTIPLTYPIQHLFPPFNIHILTIPCIRYIFAILRILILYKYFRTIPNMNIPPTLLHLTTILKTIWRGIFRHHSYHPHTYLPVCLHNTLIQLHKHPYIQSFTHTHIFIHPHSYLLSFRLYSPL